MTSPAGLGVVTSKRPAEDEPTSPASKHLKTYDDFIAKFEFNRQGQNCTPIKT